MGIVAVLLFTSYCIYVKSSIIADYKNLFLKETLPTLEYVEGASATLNSIQIDAFGFYGFTVKSEVFQRRIIENTELLTSNLDAIGLAGLADSNKLTTQKESMLEEVEGLQRILNAKNTDWDEARNALTAIQNAVGQLEETLSQVKARASHNAEQVSSKISDEVTDMRLLIVMSVASILLFTALSFVMEQKWISAPIKALSAQLHTITGERDLSRDIKVDSSDEVSQAAYNINQLLGSFRASNQEIQNSAAVVVESISKLNHSAEVSEEQVHKFLNSDNKCNAHG
jgi:methyl-accepting chemotaxis protein